MKGKKSLALLCLAGLLIFSQPVWAAPFPNKTKDVVQDADNYLDKKSRESFAEAMKQFPDTYKVVVVESTQPEAPNADEYAHLLYDNYNLDENAMMIVLDINTQQLGVYPGQAMQDKGAKMEMLHEKVISYYEPFRNQKEYLEGIKTFITEVNAEFDRIGQGTSQAVTDPAAPATDGVKASEATKSKSIWLDLPWWLYVIGLTFLVLVAAFIYSFIRRRQVFGELDDTEDWKDQLVDKIHQIDVDKPVRRSAVKVDEWNVELANRKEHLLHVRMIDIEMMIMEAEEACDRFRFGQARELIEECRHLLETTEAEVAELIDGSQSTGKQVQRQPAKPFSSASSSNTGTAQPAKTTKKEDPISNVALPVLGKQFETVERKLTNLRLDYGMSFHELKVQLDQVEHIRHEAASGDEEAIQQLQEAEQQLQKLSQTLESIPSLVHLVEKELRDELKPLEEGIVAATSDGYDLGANDLDAALLQVKTVLKEARTALEDGHIEKAKKLADAFAISLEKTYERIEASVKGKREAAAAQVVEEKREEAPVMGDVLDSTVPAAEEVTVSAIPELLHSEVDEARAQLLGANAEVDLFAKADDKSNATEFALEPKVASEQLKQQIEEELAKQSKREDLELSEAESVTKAVAEPTSQPEPMPVLEEVEPEEEYELVIPKTQDQAVAEEVLELAIESEDDVLDELERINNVLVRIRQQLKRSYLPGIPEQLKYCFEQSVHNLAKIQMTMEQYNYSLPEVTILLNEANELLQETELLAERTITACQTAEGAIQYTNRYRRQNRQVNELLNKAEQAFRLLEFQEALKLAEDARLLIEGGESQAESRWILRKKKRLGQ
ncbi:MAG: septation ring formation regulator EzrA [Clostridia bacterium]